MHKTYTPAEAKKLWEGIEQIADEGERFRAARALIKKRVSYSGCIGVLARLNDAIRRNEKKA